MIKIIKKKNNFNKTKKFVSNFLKINIYFIDKTIYIENIKIIKKKKKIYFFNQKNKSFFDINKNINIYFKKNYIYFEILEKKILSLYLKLLKLKLKEIKYRFKSILTLKGIGFKAWIKNKKLFFKLGFSHNISIKIPNNITIYVKGNKILFISNNFILLKQYISFIKNFKKPETYKGKGLYIDNEKIKLKEGKKK